MIKPLTKKEKEILDFIKVSSQIHGYSPSLLEIRDHFRLNAVSTVHEHISNLKKKGYIVKEVSQARSIKIIDTELSDQDFLEIPLSFQITPQSIMRDSPKRGSIYVHKSSLVNLGRYFALTLNSDIYAGQGILSGDILVVRECDKLPFGRTALASVNDRALLGQIIEHKQLPALKKLSADAAVVLKFNILGELVLLNRKF